MRGDGCGGSRVGPEPAHDCVCGIGRRLREFSSATTVWQVQGGDGRVENVDDAIAWIDDIRAPLDYKGLG